MSFQFYRLVPLIGKFEKALMVYPSGFFCVDWQPASLGHHNNQHIGGSISTPFFSSRSAI